MTCERTLPLIDRLAISMCQEDAFDMLRWSSSEDDCDAHRAYHRTHGFCGTPACLAGHTVAVATDEEYEHAKKLANSSGLIEAEIPGIAAQIWADAHGEQIRTPIRYLFHLVEVKSSEIIIRCIRKLIRLAETNDQRLWDADFLTRCSLKGPREFFMAIMDEPEAPAEVSA